VTPKPGYVVVIRCSRLDGYDPIAEIDKIIKVKKEAWFGKYGQPLGGTSTDALETKEREVFALLVRKRGEEEEGEPYIYKSYRVLKVQLDQTPPTGLYPRYYGSFMNRIRSWVHLEPYAGPQMTLDDLTTRSSGLPLIQSLQHSMKGHFNAVLRIRKYV
jgi:hypothetical protein